LKKDFENRKYMESGQTEQGASHTELVMVFSDLLDPARPKNP